MDVIRGIAILVLFFMWVGSIVALGEAAAASIGPIPGAMALMLYVAFSLYFVHSLFSLSGSPQDRSRGVIRSFVSALGTAILLGMLLIPTMLAIAFPVVFVPLALWFWFAKMRLHETRPSPGISAHQNRDGSEPPGGFDPNC